MFNRGMFKSIALIVVILCAVSITFAGCGAANQPAAATASAAATTQASAEAATTQAAATTPAPAEKVNILFWNRQFEDWNKKWCEDMVKEFNSTSTTVQVDQQFIPPDAWDQKIKAAYAANTAPDSVIKAYNNIATDAKNGLIQPMDPLVDPAIWTDLYPNVEQSVMYKGQHYAYPQLLEPSCVLYYRTDLFQAAGLDPAKPPKTYAEFLDYAKKLTKNGVFGAIIPTGGDCGWSTWGWQMAAAGHLSISDDWSKSTVLDGDGYKNLLTFWKSLYDNKVVPKQALGPYVDMKPYGEGKAAMAFDGSWGFGQLKATYPKMVPLTAVAPAPTFDGNQAVTTATAGGWTYCIDAKTTKAKQTAEFIVWALASDPARDVSFFKASSWSKFSPRKSVDEAINADPEAAGDAVRKTIADQIVKYAIPEPIYLWDVSMAVANAMDNVAFKGMSVDAALTKADKDINDIIAKNKLAGTNPKMDQ